MNLKRTTTIVVVGALVAWLAGAATANHTIPRIAVVQQTPIEKRGAELALEIERLHERLAPAVAPSAPGRNLFTFRPAAVHPAALPPAPLRAAISEAAPMAPALPPLK